MLQKVNVQRCLLSEVSNSKNILKIDINFVNFRHSHFVTSIFFPANLGINYFYKKGVQMFLYVKHVGTWLLKYVSLVYMCVIRMIFLHEIQRIRI